MRSGWNPDTPCRNSALYPPGTNPARMGVWTRNVQAHRREAQNGEI